MRFMGSAALGGFGAYDFESLLATVSNRSLRVYCFEVLCVWGFGV